MIYEDLLLSIVTSVNKYLSRSGAEQYKLFFPMVLYLFMLVHNLIIYFISFSLVSLVKVKLEINLAANINEALYYILFGKIVRDMVSN